MNASKAIESAQRTVRMAKISASAYQLECYDDERGAWITSPPNSYHMTLLYMRERRITEAVKLATSLDDYAASTIGWRHAQTGGYWRVAAREAIKAAIAQMEAAQ